MTTTRGPQSHDPRHQAEADLQEKGLRAGSVGLLGGVVLGISSVAPAYALTATIGILVAEASDKMAVVIIAGFLPMFFAAYAYRELNKVAPDCGTSFTWTTKSFGPYVGWIGGWAAILATVIVLSNLAGVAVQFFYQFVGEITGSENISTLWENRLVNVVTCLAFLAIATFVAYRGITTTERVQFILVGFQMVLLVVFAVAALAKSGSSDTGLSFSWSWFSPSGLTLSAFIAGLSGSIFAFWGWDTSLTVNEESKDSDTTPGRAALLCVVSILLTYLLVAIATQMYAGVGEEGLGLGNPGDRGERLRCAGRTRAGQPAQSVPLPRRPGVERRQSHHHVSSVVTHHAGDGYVPRLPAAVRDGTSALSDAVLCDVGRRRRRCDLLRGADVCQRERPHGHDLLTGHHDLLLLRARLRSPASGTSGGS